jgi:hypothetical protein
MYHLCRTEKQNTRKLLFNEWCTPGLMKLLGFVVLGRRRGRCLIQGGILAFGWKDWSKSQLKYPTVGRILNSEYR